MASFTDAISQFNPYVQQLPVELMAKVGMQKQAQYDAGVQKVQAQIDNVAGLEVARSIDKQYLQSKLGELGNNLKAFAAGDFSNQQLVNSISGMTGQIVKDEQIINAVASTANIKKQDALMEKEAAKGEGLENQDLYNDQKAKYLASTDAKSSFTNGRYIPYINIHKKLKDIADSVGVDSSKIPQLYETDGNGNPIPQYIIDKKTGKQIFNGFKWNSIMATESIKGKDAEKLLSAFKASLTPADYQQLAITGRYTYKNYTPEQLVEIGNVSYDNQLRDIDAAIEKQRLYLFNAENSGKPNEEDITTHANLYKTLNEQRDQLLLGKSKLYDDVVADPDKAKANLYTNTYLSRISTDMASQERSIDYDVSPLFDIFDKNRNYEAKIAQDRINNYFESQKLIISKSADQRAWAEYNAKYGVNPDTGLPFGSNAPLDVENAGAQIVSQNENAYIEQVGNANQIARELTKSYFKSLPGNEDLTDEQLDKKIANTLKKYNAPIIEGEQNAILNNFANKMLALYAKDKNKIPVENRSLVDQYKASLESATYSRTIMEDVDKQASIIAKQRGIDVQSIKDVEKSIKPLSIDIKRPNGTRRIILDKDDVKDIAAIGVVASSLFNSKEDKDAADIAQNRLIRKFGQSTWADIKHDIGIKVPYSGLPKEISEIVDKIKGTRSKELTKIKAELYKEIGYLPQGVGVAVTAREGEKESAVGDRLFTVLQNYEGTISNYDNLVAGINSGKFTAAVNIQPTVLGGENKYFLNILSGSEKGVVEINADNYSYLTGRKPAETAEVPAFVRYTDAKGTSNITGAPNPSVGNKFKDADFVNYNNSNYTLTGDYVVDKGNPNLYHFKIYKHDKSGKTRPKVLTFDQPIPKKVNNAINPQLEFVPYGITDDLIQRLENKK